MSLTLQHVSRYAQIARLLARYGRDLASAPPEVEAALADEGESAAATPTAEAFVADLEKLGPTFVKLGQVLSARADLLPLPYLTALSRLHDQVKPFEFELVGPIVEAELGVRLSKGFLEFEREPLAAASLGQVHRARLRDGRAVAVKVQRPGIHETVKEDLAALRELAGWIESHSKIGRRYPLVALVEEFGRTLARELDYRVEAKNLKELGELTATFERIVIPAPVDDYTSAKVLTMELVHGRKVTEIAPLQRMEIDGAALADELFRAYLHQILVAGFFHADPHPGNVFVTDDGRIALIDLGMVGRISAEMQERMLRLLLALSEERSEEAAKIAVELGERTDDFDPERFAATAAGLATRLQRTRLVDVEVGRTVLELVHEAADAGLRMPTELALLGKTLLQLDQIGRALDPEFDPNAAVRRHAVEITTARARTGFTGASVMAGVNDLRELLRRMPDRVGKILDRIANNELEVKVNAIDEKMLMAGFQKVANRIAVGLVLAALIVGAAMLMQVPTSFRLWGYPGLPMLFFLAAAGGGIALVISIVRHDLPSRRKTPPSGTRA